LRLSVAGGFRAVPVEYHSVGKFPPDRQCDNVLCFICVYG